MLNPFKARRRMREWREKERKLIYKEVHDNLMALGLVGKRRGRQLDIFELITEAVQMCYRESRGSDWAVVLRVREGRLIHRRRE